MIGRYMYLGFLDGSGLDIKRPPEVGHLSLATFKGMIFMYFESESGEIDPHNIAQKGLKSYPNGARWQRMMDIFHYSKPLDASHWERKYKEKQPVFKVIYLRPEMVSSYVFYHYQLQEEKPGLYDKYGMIFLLGNLLVMYLETPREEETRKYPGKLSTHNTPDDWSDLMAKHFAPWEDFEGEWRQIEVLNI